MKEFKAIMIDVLKEFKEFYSKYIYLKNYKEDSYVTSGTYKNLFKTIILFWFLIPFHFIPQPISELQLDFLLEQEFMVLRSPHVQ